MSRSGDPTVGDGILDRLVHNAHRAGVRRRAEQLYQQLDILLQIRASEGRAARRQSYFGSAQESGGLAAE
jgi:hypothetical protein